MDPRVNRCACDVLRDLIIKIAEHTVAKGQLPRDELVVYETLVRDQHNVSGVEVLGLRVEQIGQPALCDEGYNKTKCLEKIKSSNKSNPQYKNLKLSFL